jgi:hypothetical protein
VEFDNGRDLTYMWSAALPEMSIALVGQAGDASSGALGPLPNWVCGSTKNSPLSTITNAPSAAICQRIVGIWLIAVSAFQRRKGICSFARIKLKSDKGEIFVGP